MKDKRHYLIGALLACSLTATAQNVHPQALPIVGEQEANPHALKALRNLLIERPGIFTDRQSAARELRIYIGEKGDKSINKYKRLIPDRPEGYYLAVDDNKIVLAGNDERGTYYAVQTLAQLLKDGKTIATEIKDYPAIRYRGVVEGFYGTPWSHEARLRQLKFYGENKMNTYIYGPKNDPYHSSPNWRLPYPEKEAGQLHELVETAKENEVDFVWAIHPGQDIKWNQEDRNALLAKFEKMYQLGIRSFAVFFDDISGEGTNPQKQAELLNYIDEKFVSAKPDVTPLIMCPTEYNKSWSNPKGNYLTTLGEKLNPSIQIMWTGDRVISDITRDGIDWINQRIKRPAYIWWNFPVSDYVRDHLLLGQVYGNDTTIASSMSGFVTNPMEHAEASKIAIYCVANYAWNPTGYDAPTVWKNAIRTILPDASEALECFATHNSDLGPNGHGYRREESTELQPVAARFLQSYLQNGTIEKNDLNILKDTFEEMEESADRLLTSTSNKPLIAEIKPWICQFERVANYGEEVLRLLESEQKPEAQAYFMRKYAHVRALQRQMFAIDQTSNQNPYQPGVKTASKVIKPLIDQLFVSAVNRYNHAHGTLLEAEAGYMPHKLTSDVEQIKNLPLQVKNNRVLVSPSNEVVKWPAGKSVTIELDKSYPGKSLQLNFGKKEPCDWVCIEVSSDGNDWQTVKLNWQNDRLTADLQQQPLRWIRAVNVSNDEQQIYLRQFVLTLEGLQK
ncbi:beta-N-acetylglucosaminidase [Bacteroides helcogenes]|uniref:protein O-GlcNAcase n=1 Tax=Bacteroides helcogenes (strain ATCC 35417 / DSM 20613 / JCM 6297 / CCUG 15421 / P 36-108) TaxID=693979 RepID=E6SP84_BACT6|nr:beta-N-acetylglucosaminidase [Bacteroides helcogenes]ADV44841.1 Beta-N-acetylhexosaminidase [Bacteroides helcogenes P 36-108]MDY5239699.1 beta-N-acetylglucosaminidase [Bacteroides helcogenes]